jgi:hypothetical protein
MSDKFAPADAIRSDRAVLEVAFRAASAHIDSLDRMSVGPTATTASLRAKLAGELPDDGIPPTSSSMI